MGAADAVWADNNPQQDRYGTGGFLINRPYLQLCDEMRALPVPREVLEDWLWRNATRVLRLDT